MLQSIIKNLLHIVLPTPCRACGKNLIEEAQPFFCDQCWAGIRPIPPPVCPCCGEPFVSSVALEYSPGHLCGGCRDRPPAFDSARAVGYYQGVLVEAIRLLKYQAKTKLSRCLAARMCDEVRKIYRAAEGVGSGFDAVLAVPLHPARLREREFNQALLLARGLSSGLKLPLLVDGLERMVPTRPQVELDGDERRKNVRKAFRVKRPGRVEGRRLLLVDDVYTTGATVNECAKVLKKAGAKAVHVMTLARMGGLRVG
jgi:ComF family protein